MSSCFRRLSARSCQVIFAIAFFWYVLFAPVTLPLTAFVCWRCLFPSKQSDESEAFTEEDDLHEVLQDVLHDEWREGLQLEDDLQADLDFDDDFVDGLREERVAVAFEGSLAARRGGRISSAVRGDGAGFVDDFVKRRTGADEIGGDAIEMPVLARERSTAETEAEGLEPTSPPPSELTATRSHAALRGAALREQAAKDDLRI
eukprot:6175695-Pleurochrysis_carterae.AAC.2